MCICGKESCTGLCGANIGRKLAEFYINWRDSSSIKDIEIGKTEPERVGSKDYLMSIGAEYYPRKDNGGVTSQSRILTRFSKIKGIKIENIFDCDKSTINRSLNDFSKLKGVSPALIAETKKFYSDLYDYKKVLMPINIDNKVEVAVHKNEINKPKTYMRDGIVKKMRWSLDEDGRLGCQFLVLPEREQMSKWRSIDDFGVELFDKTIKISNIGKENDLVKMHKFGYMKPVVIAGDKQMICVDNASLYVGSNIKGLREIGMWEGNNIKTAELASITEENLLELLKSYRPYLAVVRRRMAPYLVSEPTITRVSDLMA